jgi:hypothetical protein
MTKTRGANVMILQLFSPGKKRSKILEILAQIAASCAELNGQDIGFQKIANFCQRKLIKIAKL